MCVRVFICGCVFVYVFVCVCVFKFVRVSMCLSVCMFVSAAQRPIYDYRCINIYIYIYMHMPHTDKYIYICIYMRICTYTHAYI